MGIEENIDKELVEEVLQEEKTYEDCSTETVNHPQHYNREGAMECLDEMILIYGIEAVMCFCLCNAHKYRYRATHKNGEDDLRKSDWYMNKYKELRDQSTQLQQNGQ